MVTRRRRGTSRYQCNLHVKSGEPLITLLSCAGPVFLYHRISMSVLSYREYSGPEMWLLEGEEELLAISATSMLRVENPS